MVYAIVSTFSLLGIYFRSFSCSSPFSSVAAFTIEINNGRSLSVEEEEEGILQAILKESVSSIPPPPECHPSTLDPSLLKDPCELDASLNQAPDRFSLIFPTQYGSFKAHCVRDRAPIWADRVYKLAKNGYYNANYFFRVIPGKYTQFGTNGYPDISNMYNYTSTTDPECSILEPQPPYMPYCMKSKESEGNHCEGVDGLSNDFGTLAMSTSYKEGLEDYPNGVTWNATAELFINTGNNQRLDENLFVPICTISKDDMNNVILKFPSFGEMAELGGDGPSLGMLYQDGNEYIESNEDWASMAITGGVEVCP